MPRKERIEFAGALYHVISRGNYRKDLFTHGRSGEAFEQALFEACERCGWILHAYVVMSNHYHLALETPQANLVSGTRWLQSTFAGRFNRYRKESGHVFQGRYKALLVQPGAHLARLVDYIHLNPVRARICEFDALRQYPLSSYGKFFNKKRPEFLHRSRFLAERGFRDSTRGMQGYAKWLESQIVQEPEASERLRREMMRGWAIGDDNYRKELAERLLRQGQLPSLGASERREILELEWELKLTQYLEQEKKTLSDIQRDRKGAAWKQRIALELRKATTAPNPWISQHLNCGHPSYISKWLKNQRF